MTILVDKTDLQLTFDYVTSGGSGEHEAYLDKDAVTFLWHSEYGDNFDELPEDLGNDRYIEIPHKNELNLGKNLVFTFVIEYMPSSLSKVEGIFRKKGAYHRFKVLLERSGMLDKWFAYEEDALDNAIKEWCELNKIELKG